MAATVDTPTSDALDLDAGSPRRRLIAVAAAALLIAPAILSFYSGGYFDAPRIWAGLGVWGLVAVAAIACPRPVPRGPGVRAALVGLLLLAAWTLASMAWAPIAGSAYHAGQLAGLYAGALLAAAALLRAPRTQRAVEPALAAGTALVIGYGLAGRLLPGLLHFARSISAEGRLEQPLTYWNAMGEVAALGCVLAIRLAGDGSRPRATRAVAAAAVAPLGMGLYLSFSRGALFACAAGLVTLAVAAPQRAQAWALVRGVAAGALAAVASAPFRGVTALAGPLSHRERDGAIVLVLLIVIAAVAAGVQWWAAAHEAAGTLHLPRRAPLLALLVICCGLALAIVVGAKESSGEPLASGSGRLVSLQSNRYAYWRVALRAFGTEPLYGVGAGGWAVDWLRWRPFNEGAQDAHSLELQTLAELGLVGLALLAAFLAGVALAARAAWRAAPIAAAGPIAACVAYLAHSPLDWDWQMPAVTLIAILLAGLLLALASPGAGAPLPGTRRPVLIPAVALAAAGLVVCLWFGLGALQTHDENDATALVQQPGSPSPALTGHILSLLSTADTLNPDRNIALLRSQALSRAGRAAAAVSVARRVADAEPLNIDAWTVLAFAAQTVDPALAARARSRVLTLAPPVPAAP